MKISVLLPLLPALFSLTMPAFGSAGTWRETLQPRDLDGDGVADAYFDEALGVTWLADLAIASPNFYTTRSDGQMIQANAQRYAADFVLHGVDGWRLPRTNFTVLGICEFDVFGGGVCGYKPDPGSSELAYMYYVTLGGTGFPDDDYGLPDAGPFRNLRPISYWSETPYLYERQGFAFSMFNGVQNGANTGNELGVWLVRDGDVLSVPLPSTLPLLGLGLLMLGLPLARRS